MLSVSAILFDLDGTLIDSKKDLALSIHYLQKKYHRPASPEDAIARFIGDGVNKLVERAIGTHRPTGRKRSPMELGEAVELFKLHYRQHAMDHTAVYPGVLQMLAHFHRKKMAVVTNKPVRISKRILQSLGLIRYFPVVLGGDSVIRKKPDPEALLSALKFLNVPPGPDVLMVGDSYQDVEAGRAAGVQTCGIFSNIGDRKMLKNAGPDYTVHSLADLMRLFS